VVRKTSDLTTAIPMLVAQGRETVAIARLQAADDKDRAQAFAAFARAWLDRNEDDKELTIQVAVANAIAGDARGTERLNKALEKGEAIEQVARGLAALKTPLCPFVVDKLDASTPALRVAVLSVLRFSPDGGCLSWVVKLAKDHQIPQDERVSAIQALAGRDEPEARNALKELLKESNAVVRAAATLAEARAGAGKSALFRLTPQLRDGSVEMRAAAAAAIVRVGGEDALSQLFLLFKERDARPYEAVARELALLSGDDSAAMLGRILRKDDHRIRLAGARALARRHDPAAAKIQASLAAGTDPELRFLAGDAAESDKRSAAAAVPEGYTWLDSYAALVAGNGKLAAVDWVLAQFPKLAPAARVDAMATWLAAAPVKDKVHALSGQ
jgi:HEAT repeat protein